MNFKMNVPALCANEVYTLTFNHKSESETVQIKVGDLTLETSEKRVVFTTINSTSTIESDTELFDIDLYEGVYVSDVEDGEYVEESKSFLLGHSIKNLKNRNNYVRSSDPSIATTTFTEDGYQNIQRISTGRASISSTMQDFANDKMAEDTTTPYTVIVYIRRNTFPSDYSVDFLLSHSGYVKKGEASRTITGGSTGIIKCLTVKGNYNLIYGHMYWGTPYNFQSLNGVDESEREDLIGCELEYGVQVFEGDYYDSDLITGYFEGLGCVKAPTIQSVSHGENLFPMKTNMLNINNQIYIKDNNIYMKHITSSRGYITIPLSVNDSDVKMLMSGDTVTNNDMKNYTMVNSKQRIEKGFYILSCIATTTGTGTYRLGVYDGGGIEILLNKLNGVKKYIAFELTEESYGMYFTLYNGEEASFENITLLKITEEEYKALNYPTYKGESCKVTTPDNLELNGTNDDSNTWYGDKLDLNSSKLYKYYDMRDLFTLISECGEPSTGFYTTPNNFTYVGYDISSIYGEGVIKTNSAGFPTIISDYFECVYYTDFSNIVYQSIVYSDGKLYFALPSSVYSGVGQIEVNQLNPGQALLALYNYLATNPIKIGIPLVNPIEVELEEPLKPLKVYENGGINLSSSQVRPQLSTTLPVGNTFEYTGLVAGASYKISFEGNATTLVCGGAAKINPVSPCLITCGSTDTKLIINGNNIRNVRVVFSSVENEINTNVTGSHVDMSKMSYKSYFFDKRLIADNPLFTASSVNGGSPDYRINADNSIYCANNTNNCSAKFDTDFLYDKNISLLLIECDINMPASNLCAEIAFSGAIPVDKYNFRELKLNNDSASIAQGTFNGNFSTKVKTGHFSKLVYINNPLYTTKFSVILHTGLTVTSSYIADGNNAEGSLDGYTYTGAKGCTVSNFKLSLIENYPEGSFNDITSRLRSNDGQGIVWTDTGISHSNMLLYDSIFSEPIKLRSLPSGVSDRYNLVTREYSKYIVQNPETGEFTSLSEPIRSIITIGDNPEPFFRNHYHMLLNNSDTFPTTVLEPATTNNYYIGSLEANKVYTLRFEGSADNVRLGLNDNIAENNSLINTGRSSNVQLTFVNPVNVDNVMLFKEDVRDQDINYFTGIDTVQVKDILNIAAANNMTSMLSNEYKMTKIGTATKNITLSLHGGVFNATARGLHSTLGHVIGILSPELMDNKQAPTYRDFKPFMKAGVAYKVKYTMTISHLTNGAHDYVMQFFDKYGNQVKCNTLTNLNYTDEVFKVNIASGSVDKEVMYTPQKDVYTCGIYTPNGITWDFTLTLKQFTITEPEATVSNTNNKVNLKDIVILNKFNDEIFDTYNPITGEYVQNTKFTLLDGSDDEKWVPTGSQSYFTNYIDNEISRGSNVRVLFSKRPDTIEYNEAFLRVIYNSVNNSREFSTLLKENPIYIIEKLDTPIVTNLKQVKPYYYNNGYCLIDTVTNKVFPKSSYSLQSTNIYDTSKWNKDNSPISVRNINKMYINDGSGTEIPIDASKTMTIKSDQIVNNKVIITQANNAVMVLNGDYSGRDIPYTKESNSVGAFEIETGRDLGSPTFNKGGRK